MKQNISSQTKYLNRDILAALRMQLGRNFVSFYCTGSRATGEDLPDSDYDGYCFVRNVHVKYPNLSEGEKKYNIRIGIALKSYTIFRNYLANNSRECFYRSLVLDMKFGRARFVGGRNLSYNIPSLKHLLPLNLKRGMQFEYWFATLIDSPSNVLKREPRRHIGFIIAMCEILLLMKGVVVKKENLPQALHRYYPAFRVIRLLRTALWRRHTWILIKHDKKEIASIRRDVKKFLKILRSYLFSSHSDNVSPKEAREQMRCMINQSHKNTNYDRA